MTTSPAEPEPFAQALRVLAEMPAVLRPVVQLCQAAGALDRRADAEAWSPRAILAHLLIVERDINAPRLRRLAGEDGMLIQPSASASTPRGDEDAEQTLAAWAAERARTVAWLGTLPPGARKHCSVQPKRGRVSLEEHVVEWAYHDLDHTRQLVGALAAGLYPHIGAWQALYRPPS